MAKRPSYLQVDRWVAARDRKALAELDGDPEWVAHLGAVQREIPVPDWVRELEERRHRGPTWWMGVALTAALAMLLVVAVTVGRDDYLGVKGGLDATVYLEDGAWDGSPLEPGVPLRVELHGLPTEYYAVLLEEEGDLTLVSAGRWPEHGVVPGAWAFDGPPAADATLLILALDEDPSGQPVEALLDRAVAEHVEPPR